MNNMRQDIEYEAANEAARDAVREAIEVVIDGKTDLIALEACVPTHLDGGDEFARIDSARARARALDAVAQFLSLLDRRAAGKACCGDNHVRE